MTYTPIPRGTQDWDVPVNDTFTDQDARITQNTADILTNSTNINALQSAVATNTTNIATNTANIATNTANIATNTSNIATNTANIAAVTTTANNAVPKGTLMVNVQDFGAVGNNAGDQAAAINSAVSALGGNGGIVYFPPGLYRLGGSTVVTLPANTVLQGAGPGASAITIGSSFTGAQAVNVTGDGAQLKELTIRGVSSSVATNPTAYGVSSVNNQRFKVTNCYFKWVNNYAIQAWGDTTDITTDGTTLHGGVILNTNIESCSGGVWVKTTNGGAMSGVWPANFQIVDLSTRFLGVNAGTNANLDGIRIEDSGDVLLQNVIPWMNATGGGTGAALRVVGNCAAIFIQNLDALGPQTGVANVQIETGANGDPQNVQIIGGVIQQGLIGLNIVGASQHVRVENVRILNNQTHGVVIGGTAQSVYVDKCLFSTNGQVGTGNNYDINCTTTGTDVSFLTFNRHSSGTVTAGSGPGIQAFHNVTAATRTRVFGANFAGSTGTVANWFAGSVLPNAVHHSTAGNNEFTTGITYRSTGITNARAGTTAAMTAGSVAVSNTSVTTNSVITASLKTAGGTVGSPFVSVITPGSGFTLKSTSGTDTSVYNYFISEII